MGQGQTGRMLHTYEHGDTYDGDFVNGKRHGSGVYVSANGARYEGEWKDDMRHGYGILSFTAPESLDQGGGNGMSAWAGTYEGEWVKNLKSGTGTFNYANGDRYVGQWSDDKKHFQGVYSYANGDKFFGEFLYGAMHGSGIYTYSTGAEIVGRWQNDVQDGLSVFKAADGSLREESWSEGERMSSRPIGNADPLAISAQLDSERIRRKCSMDTSQWHLLRKTSASERGTLSSVSPRIAPPPVGAHTNAEMLEKLAQIQIQQGVLPSPVQEQEHEVDEPPDEDASAHAAGNASSAAASSSSSAAAAPSSASSSGSTTEPASSSSSSGTSVAASASSSSASSTTTAAAPLSVDVVPALTRRPSQTLTSAAGLKTPSHATAAAHQEQEQPHSEYGKAHEVDVAALAPELVDVE